MSQDQSSSPITDRLATRPNLGRAGDEVVFASSAVSTTYVGEESRLSHSPLRYITRFPSSLLDLLPFSFCLLPCSPSGPDPPGPRPPIHPRLARPAQRLPTVWVVLRLAHHPLPLPNQRLPGIDYPDWGAAVSSLCSIRGDIYLRVPLPPVFLADVQPLHLVCGGVFNFRYAPILLLEVHRVTLSMGILPALDSRPCLVLPDTPPELVSSGASPYSSSSSLPADQSWISPTLTSPSMSKYDKTMTAEMSADHGVEGGQSRPDSAAQAAPRQQLPSLSSLFGPPTAARPANSPVSERPGSYSATSPLDRPRAPSGDRHHPASYFSQTLSPPVSQPRSTYDAKFESDRHPPHGLARAFSGPESPRLRNDDHARPTSRADSHAGKWPVQPDAGRHEYSLGSRDQSFRSPQDQFRLHFPGSKDRVAPTFADQRPANGTPNPPPTPTSTVVSEGVLSKDGLGPKIWTGTHFLPRFVRAAEVPGEGMCYFYDDGSHCKTVIDGEAVNAHWGVTKAGKPRKRLAIACVTCREKKIKCDPDYPRCVQCEKFGRICKFKNAPRGGHNSPSTPPAELDDMRKLSGPSRQNDLRMSESETSSPVSPRTTLRPSSPDTDSHKRLRVSYDSYVPAGPPLVSLTAEPTRARYPVQHEAAELPRISDDVLNRAWGTDPTLSDPQSIRAVISHFFVQLDSMKMMRFVPEALFKAWVTNPNHRKSPEDLMLLYSILAVGVALSGGPKTIAFEYAQVAQYAQRVTVAGCLQLVQSRILLALYYMSISRMPDAHEMILAAAATSTYLKLNVELEESHEVALASYPLGMSKVGYRETRRRTFWSVFILERLNGHFPERPAMINAEDIYTRLPADPRSFEREVEGSSPMFNPYHSNFGSGNDLGVSAYLVEMVHMWSDGVSRIYRMSRRTSLLDTDFESQRMLKRIQDWHRALPSRLRFSSSNLESAAHAEELGPFLTMHLLYNHAMIKLSRHGVVAGRASQTTSLHVQRCFEHSTNVLDAIKALLRLQRGGQEIIGGFPPVIAMAATEAVDVLTASGRLTHLGDVIDSVRMVLSVVDAMCAIWEDFRNAREVIEGRLGMLLRIRDRGNQPTSPVESYRIVLGAEEHGDEKGLRWQFNNPIESLYPKDMDTIYSAVI
ncbi:hypothetical protein AK830_g8185 [Neonectria ditissima]|uniref:Zn(2)-C6 fungal-type domain-containing protein n=1 Tax=Neonectria ditissima TaxID=78410 RepID=A0A0P7BER5_9HYPO|nr:hypothetical protein AK830_g8185 [Neonectria ditissima]